jgi:predicted metal-dependent peptidase
MLKSNLQELQSLVIHELLHLFPTVLISHVGFNKKLY